MLVIPALIINVSEEASPNIVFPFAVKAPETVKLERVPTLVIAVCVGVVNVPATLVKVPVVGRREPGTNQP